MVPHLLTIPRELRDKIYEYLHSDIEKGYLVKFEGVKAAQAISVRTEQAPLSSVLLVHSRLYAEYRESVHFKDISVIFDVSSDPGPQTARKIFLQVFGPILPQLRHAVLLVDGLRIGGAWEGANCIFAAIPSLSESLETFQIACRTPDLTTERQVQDHMSSGRACLPAFHSSDLEERRRIAGLAQVQIGISLSIEFNPALSPPNSKRIHIVHTVDMYSFARSTRMGRYWTQEQLFGCWKPREYPEDLSRRISTTEMSRIRGRLGKALEWEEVRDDESAA